MYLKINLKTHRSPPALSKALQQESGPLAVLGGQKWRVAQFISINHRSRNLKPSGRLSLLELGSPRSLLLRPVPSVPLHVLHLGHDLPRVAAGVEVVRVQARLQLGALLPAVPGEDVLVVLEVVVVELVQVFLWHLRWSHLDLERFVTWLRTVCQFTGVQLLRACFYLGSGAGALRWKPPAHCDFAGFLLDTTQINTWHLQMSLFRRESLQKPAVEPYRCSFYCCVLETFAKRRDARIWSVICCRRKTKAVVVFLYI